MASRYANNFSDDTVWSPRPGNYDHRNPTSIGYNQHQPLPQSSPDDYQTTFVHSTIKPVGQHFKIVSARVYQKIEKSSQGSKIPKYVYVINIFLRQKIVLTTTKNSRVTDIPRVDDIR